MGSIVEKLKALFSHTIVHEALAKQASELPSKVNFLEMSKKFDLPPNGWGERPKHGSIAKLARSMTVGQWTIAPSKKVAQNLKHAIDAAHGKSSAKTKTIKNSPESIYVWRCK